MEKISITINNQVHLVRANASVLQACEEMLYDVPRFCYHEKLSVAGNCRMCLVEIQKSPKPVVSCAMPISKGMVIFTYSPCVKKAREAVLELLLINHPLDCPICDQGGECDLQDETLNYAADRGRFFEFKRSVEDKEVGPIIKTIMTRCIHCTRCIRFATEIGGQEILGAFGRGQETEIGTYIQTFIKNELSGNLIDLCPVGALTSKPYAYMARNWELIQTETVDFFDAFCSDIIVSIRNITVPSYQYNHLKIISEQEIIRILPKTNGLYADNWISDRTRYAFDGLKNQRIKKKINLNWLQIELQQFLFDFTQLKKIGIILGPLSDLKSIYILHYFLKYEGGIDIQYGNFHYNLNIDIPFFYNLNRIIKSFEDLNGLLLIGTNIRYEASLLNTILRKEQIKRALFYGLIGTSITLRIKNIHLGNSLKSLLNIIENKNVIMQYYYNYMNSSILFGFENLKMSNGFFIQNIIRNLGKNLFIKTKSGERLGMIHANIGSLNISNLGIIPGVRSKLYIKEQFNNQFKYLFTLQNSDIQTKKWISTKTQIFSFSTHQINTVENQIVLPIKNLYEKESFTYNIENRLRQFTKIISAPINTYSVENFISAFQIVKKKWIQFMQPFWNFEDDCSIQNNLEQVSDSFMINLFSYFENEGLYSKVTIFYPSVLNFYLNDMISTHSIIMGECAIFLQQENENFQFEM